MTTSVTRRDEKSSGGSSNITQTDAGFYVSKSISKQEIKNENSDARNIVDSEEVMYYKINDKRRKIAVIFNHSRFERKDGIQSSDRQGTDEDCIEIENSLNKLGFEVTVHQNPEMKVIYNEIESASKMSAAEVSCLIVVVMTHGGQDGFLTAYDFDYHKDSLFTPFTSETTGLAGVPKIFFIQACRGAKRDDGIQVDCVDGPPERAKIPSHADILVMYATIEKYFAYREADGSWFIKEICHQLKKNSRDFHLLEMLTFVNGRVARNYRSIDHGSDSRNNKKQMPQIESTLTKLLHFSR